MSDTLKEGLVLPSCTTLTVPLSARFLWHMMSETYSTYSLVYTQWLTRASVAGRDPTFSFEMIKRIESST